MSWGATRFGEKRLRVLQKERFGPLVIGSATASANTILPR